MKNQQESMKILEEHESMDINIPLQKLFDECLNFISITDFVE